jgi:tetratricopeptide (TPR) repeat protein
VFNHIGYSGAQKAAMCYRAPLLAVVVIGACALHASDQLEEGLTFRAQSDFDRVEVSGRPQIQETNACVQSQVAEIAVAPRAELSSLYFRKGYCELIEATLNHRSGDFQQAAASFQKSIEAWPDTLGRNPKNEYPQPVPSSLRILAAIAPLEGGRVTGEALMAAGQEIFAAAEPPVCPAFVLQPTFCQLLLQVGHEWMGWLALKRGDLVEARRDLSSVTESPWAQWITGQQAFHDRNYQQASEQYWQAVTLWMRALPDPPNIAERLAPQPDLPLVWMQLGEAQFLAGSLQAAITSLDNAIKINPNSARAIYYRARAEELQGQAELALADYTLASRTAFANAENLKSGEAHLYRGILFFRRKDFARAEDEFSSALNFGISADLLPDAQAWRHMAAVAGGACGASRQLLEDSLARVSPLFPKQEARKLAAACPLSPEVSQVSGGLP